MSRGGRGPPGENLKWKIAYSINWQYYGIIIIIILLPTHLKDKVETEKCNYLPKTIEHQSNS